LKQAWLCPRLTSSSSSLQGIVKASFASALASFVSCAKFAQNLCLASYSSNLFLERKELLEVPLNIIFKK
ncbi:MAG: hypothetical protein PF590_01720, partial [Candidatus Delongbacteria bacterium]|nr:hypothetical protein [Candidatus Delongbacteria bacterium]